MGVKKFPTNWKNLLETYKSLLHVKSMVTVNSSSFLQMKKQISLICQISGNNFVKNFKQNGWTILHFSVQKYSKEKIETRDFFSTTMLQISIYSTFFRSSFFRDKESFGQTTLFLRKIYKRSQDICNFWKMNNVISHGNFFLTSRRSMSSANFFSITLCYNKMLIEH